MRGSGWHSGESARKRPTSEPFQPSPQSGDDVSQSNIAFTRRHVQTLVSRPATPCSLRAFAGLVSCRRLLSSAVPCRCLLKEEGAGGRMSTRLIIISVVASASAAVAVALNGRYIDRHLRNWHHIFQPHVVTISTIIAVRAPRAAP